MSTRLLTSFLLSLLLHALPLILLLYMMAQPIRLFCSIDDPPAEIEEKLRTLTIEITSGDGSEEKQQKKSFDFSSLNDTETETPKEKVDMSQYEDGEWKELIKNLKETSDLRKRYSEEDKEKIITNSNVSQDYIQRHRHYEDMIVKEVFPTVHDAEKDFEEEIHESVEKLTKHNERNRIIKEFRHGKETNSNMQLEIGKMGESEKEEKEPLVMTPKERKEYFDTTLLLPKEEQLEQFQNRFLGYHPNKGDLPIMFRELYYKNLQRIAYVFSGDPTYFTIDYFEENLNKEDYLKNSMSLASQLQGTKTATEILFTLENIYEIQERALLQYFQNKNRYDSYPPSKKQNIRVETIRRVVEKYEPILKEKNIHSYQDVKTLYTKKRKQIIDYLLKTTPNGYRQADALLEKGRIFWEEGLQKNDQAKMNEAIQIWKSIQGVNQENGDFLYKDTYTQMLPFLATWDPKESDTTKNQFTNILNQRIAKYLEKKRKREERLMWHAPPAGLEPATQ